jgi:hypothetical protein
VCDVYDEVPSPRTANDKEAMYVPD